MADQRYGFARALEMLLCWVLFSTHLLFSVNVEAIDTPHESKGGLYTGLERGKGTREKRTEIHVAVTRGPSLKDAPVVTILDKEEASDSCASGWYQEETQTLGWGFLHIETHRSCSDVDQAFGAGYVEGALTAQQIWQHRENTIDQFRIPPKIEDYFVRNNEYLDEMTSAEYDDPKDTAYWWQVRLVREQVNGLDAGYADHASNAQKVPAMTFLVMNTDGDLYDLFPALLPREALLRRSRGRGRVPNMKTEGRRGGAGRKEGIEQLLDGKTDAEPSVSDGSEIDDLDILAWSTSDKCSGMVKLLDGNKDLYISQVAFTGLEEMLRMYKMYSFEIATVDGAGDVVPGYKAQFSSYPGHIYSGDDFYLLSSGLSLVETTLDVFNSSLYKNIKPEGQVLEWVRNIVANRLATTAEEWTEIFARYNSGTYNNEWLVIDYNLFKPEEELQPGTLWILDQMPGYIERWDATEELQRKGFFATYNSPASEFLFNISGWPKAVEKWGAWYSHKKCARALIFDRDHSKVVDLDSFKRLMRYNDYKRDPLSCCEGCNPPYDAEFAPASRGDLNDPNNTYPYPWIGQRDHSSIDGKITSYKLSKTFTSLVVSGPTCDQQPVFQWSKSAFYNLSHMGQPDRFDFPWLEIQWGDEGDKKWASLLQNSTLCDPSYVNDSSK